MKYVGTTLKKQRTGKKSLMAETEVATPPPVPVEESVGKDASEKREGRPERPKREQEEVPTMTVEEAQKALNALPKVRNKYLHTTRKLI